MTSVYNKVFVLHKKIPKKVKMDEESVKMVCVGGIHGVTLHYSNGVLNIYVSLHYHDMILLPSK
jgi:hypothetical protein